MTEVARAVEETDSSEVMPQALELAQGAVTLGRDVETTLHAVENNPGDPGITEGNNIHEEVLEIASQIHEIINQEKRDELSTRDLQRLGLPETDVRKLLDALNNTPADGQTLILPVHDIGRLHSLHDNNDVGYKINDFELMIYISPTRQSMEQQLANGKKMHKDIEQQFRALSKDEDLHRVIEIEIRRADQLKTILGTSELHIKDDDEKHIVAQGPQHASRIGFTRSVVDSFQGDDGVAKKMARLEDRIKLDSASQWTADALVVSRDARGKGLGEALVHLGNVVSRHMGAETRPMWTDATRGASDANPTQSYYEKLGAVSKAITKGNETRTVPVFDLQK